MSDQLRADHLSDERSEIGSDSVHSLLQVLRKSISEFNLLNYSFCEGLNLEDISLRHFLTHGDLSSFNDLLSFLLIQAHFG